MSALVEALVSLIELARVEVARSKEGMRQVVVGFLFYFIATAVFLAAIGLGLTAVFMAFNTIVHVAWAAAISTAIALVIAGIFVLIAKASFRG